MTTKTVPLSVRVSDEDAAFLAKLEFPDARTPSEKLRAILARERRRHEGTQDREAATELAEDMLAPAQRQLRRLELDGPQSDLLRKAYARVPELMGLLMAGPGTDEDVAGLARLETRLAAMIAGLARDFMELGLSSRDRCYDPAVVDQNLPALIELAELAKLSSNRRKDRT